MITQVLPLLDNEELLNVSNAIDNKWLSEGPWAERFLSGLQELTSSRYAVLAPNGTLGLYLAILSLDLPPGSEILVPSFTFFGSASSIVFAGHKPVFVDVSETDYTIDMQDLESKITPRTAAIMAVHIYGQAARLEAILSVANKHKLILIEDAAQAIGVKYDDKHAGTIGDIGVISFFADKTITTGEGAVILCKDQNIWNKLRLLRNQGRPNSGTFIHESLGMNFRLTDLQAAVGYAQLKKLEKIAEQRQKSYSVYLQCLDGISSVKTMRLDPRSTFIPFRFPFTSINKNKIASELEKGGVQIRSFFYPMHMQPPLQQYANPEKRCLNSEILYEHGLALPIHSNVTHDDIEYICDIIKSNS